MLRPKIFRNSHFSLAFEPSARAILRVATRISSSYVTLVLFTHPLPNDSPAPDFSRLCIALEDRLFPALAFTTHERALYYHLLRHSHFAGSRTARRTKTDLAKGVGLSSTPVRIQLRNLARKSCVRILERGQNGYLLEVLLPDEVLTAHAPSSSVGSCEDPERISSKGHTSSNVRRCEDPEWIIAKGKPPVPAFLQSVSSVQSVESSSFKNPKLRAAIFARESGRCFSSNVGSCEDPEWISAKGTSFKDPAFRQAIFNRESGRCFYCLRALRSAAVPAGFEWSLDHVVPLAAGGESTAANAVACCHECNCRKGESSAEDFLRLLYRDGQLTSTELRHRLAVLGRSVSQERLRLDSSLSNG